MTAPRAADTDPAPPTATATPAAADGQEKAADAALRISGVRVAYGRRTVLDGVELTVPPGQLVGLLGPNGSGKSTLLRALARIQRPQAGTFHLGDVDLHRLPPRARARLVAYVPQGGLGPFSLTVTEAVMLGRTPYIGLRPTRADEETAWAAIRQLDLTALADRPVDELSGGQAQRVLIARALAQQPAVLLLDEPTSALDLRHQVETLHLLRGLTERAQLCTLLAIHDLNLAARFCHRVALLHDGRLVADGAPVDAYRPDLIEQVYGLPVDVTIHQDTPEIRPRLPLDDRRTTTM